MEEPRLALGFALGVKGLGGVFSIFRKTSSRVGGFGMSIINSDKTQLLIKLLKQDPQKEAAYYEQLGRFIASYSSAEAQIHALARFYSKTDDTRARLIFGGFRLTDAIDRLRALMRVPDGMSKGILAGLVVGPEQEKANSLIEACLRQFQIIGERRDKLVHRTIIYFEESGFHVSNGFTARTLASAELSLIITLQDLKNMRVDCGTIFLTLADFTKGPDEPKWGEDELPTWRYIPPQPVPQKPERPASRRARKRQRRASQRSAE